MTAIINNITISGTPEEIKALIDLYNPPVVTTSADYENPDYIKTPVKEFEGLYNTHGNIGGKSL